jgi:hypothetical protein
VCISHLSHACYMPRSSHLPILDHPNNILWSVQVTKFLVIQSSPASRHFLQTQHPVLKHTQSGLFPFIMKDKVSHPCKATDNIMILYTVILKSVDKILWAEW